MSDLPEIQILDNSDINRLGITVATCTNYEIAQSIANHLVNEHCMDVEIFFPAQPEKGYNINSAKFDERVPKIDIEDFSK